MDTKRSSTSKESIDRGGTEAVKGRDRDRQRLRRERERERQRERERRTATGKETEGGREETIDVCGGRETKETNDEGMRSPKTPR